MTRERIFILTRSTCPCFESDAEVLMVDSVEIDGKEYKLNDEIDGIKVFDIINNHNGNKTIMVN